jgi:hypothetical protein
MIERFGDPYRPLEPDCRIVQFEKPLTPAQLQRAGDLIGDRPDVKLYVYFDAATDLDFLSYFARLRRLHVALYKLDDIAGLSYVSDLEQLTFGSTKKSFSLRFLASLPHLTSLFLVGHKKDLRAVSDLQQLTDLGLSEITLPDLSLLLPLKRLRKYANLLGGTRDLGALAQLPELEELSLMRITKLADLGVLKEIRRLKTLRLDWMRNVTALPSFAGLSRLDDVELTMMKGLTDLSPVAAAPALRRLVVADMPHLAADSFRCFIGHPRLEELWADTGRLKVNRQIKEMLPLVTRRFPNQLAD